MKASLEANLALLAQGDCLLAWLDDAAYVRTLPSVFGASIGGHMRHNLDHYRCFLAGVQSGRIDYSARTREARLETDRRHARAEIARLRRALAGLPPGGALHVRRESDPDGAWAPSSLARELDFLMSHTVHHYAIVAILCRLQDIVPEPGFGVAPSTLRHQAAQSAAIVYPVTPPLPCAP